MFIDLLSMGGLWAVAPFLVKQVESKSHENAERVPSRETVLKPADTLFRKKSTLKGLSYISYCNEMIQAL